MSQFKKITQDILRKLSNNVPQASFSVIFWDGTKENYGAGTPQFILNFKTENAAKRMISSGSLGFGEEYIDGNILVEGDIDKLLQLGSDPSLQNLKLSLGTKINILFHHFKTLNTLINSKKNISHSYDLGNDYFKLFLDKSMTYSCAYFRKENDTLEQAQLQKYEHICRKLLLKKEDTLIDIGSGWGGMLVYAAKNYGIKGVGCTISKEQYEYSKELTKKEGLENRVTFLFEDYRNMKGNFSKLVSIGMAEHVGKKYFPMFIKTIKSLTRLEGIGLLHTMGHEFDMPEEVFTSKYLFPGYYVPSLAEIVNLLGKNGLTITDVENLRLHYAKTLDEWTNQIKEHSEKIKTIIGERLLRLWYLGFKAASVNFRYGTSRLYQITFTNGLNNSLPLTREYLYT
ncbi:MAG: cyclopropane-fatty-acyl-phospholipid synthase [Elusimicrobia bacterium]|nr:cyclopropane-fatty-acyl-phospholipid synthase [Elusimicrobiota bacterium]